MTTHEYNGHKVTLYDSPGELPLDRFKAFNHYLLLDQELGSTAEDLDATLTRAVQFLSAGEQDAAVQLLQNVQLLRRSVIAGLNPRMMAFAVMVYSVDGSERKDITEAGLQSTIDLLAKQRLKWSDLTGLVDAVKKKLVAQLEALFPATAGTGKDGEVNATLRRRTLLVLDSIEAGTYQPDDARLLSIDRELLLMFPPRPMAGKKSVEIGYIKSFERAVAIVTKWAGANAWNFTVLHFHECLELIRKQNQPKRTNPLAHA